MHDGHLNVKKTEKTKCLLMHIDGIYKIFFETYSYERFLGPMRLQSNKKSSCLVRDQFLWTFERYRKKRLAYFPIGKQWNDSIRLNRGRCLSLRWPPYAMHAQSGCIHLWRPTDANYDILFAIASTSHYTNSWFHNQPKLWFQEANVVARNEYLGRLFQGCSLNEKIFLWLGYENPWIGNIFSSKYSLHLKHICAEIAVHV